MTYKAQKLIVTRTNFSLLNRPTQIWLSNPTIPVHPKNVAVARPSGSNLFHLLVNKMLIKNFCQTCFAYFVIALRVILDRPLLINKDQLEIVKRLLYPHISRLRPFDKGMSIGMAINRPTNWITSTDKLCALLNGKSAIKRGYFATLQKCFEHNGVAAYGILRNQFCFTVT
jgi:hypothetical protein